MSLLETARQRARDSLAVLCPAGAVTWAQLACSMSDEAEEDVALLAQALLSAEQPRRTVQLLQRTGLAARSLGCRYLLAKGLADSQQWDEVLQTLGKSKDTAPPLETPAETRFEPLPRVETAIALLRGRAHEKLGSREEAAPCYGDALRLDPLCVEAFSRLSQQAMCTPSAEQNLLKELVWNNVAKADASIMRAYYSARSSKYNMQAAEVAIPSMLANSRDMRLTVAERCYVQCKYRECYEETTRLVDEDFYEPQALTLHIACQVELQETNTLFYLAHRLVDADPKRAIAWFAVGAYYYLATKYEDARRYLSKAVQTDPSFGPAWIAFGHAFAEEGEHDQAMAAYSSAARLLPGSHLPQLYIGRAYASMNNYPMAERYLNAAVKMCDTDPSVFHELGVLNARCQQWAPAKRALEKALSLMDTFGTRIDRHREPTLAALGRAWHMLGDLAKAEDYYRQALACFHMRADTHAGLGFVYQSAGQHARAVECYHEALSLNPHDTFSKQMLEIALVEDLQSHLQDAFPLSSADA